MNESERLNSFIKDNISSLSSDISKNELVFTRSFYNEEIHRLYNSLDDVSETFAKELIDILIELMNEISLLLIKPERMSSFIEQGHINKQDVDAVLITYFSEFSTLGKFYEKIIENNSNCRL